MTGSISGSIPGSITTQVPIPELERVIARALEAAGTAPVNAASVARALSAAEVDGQKGHGLSRVPGYVAQVRAGKVKGHAVPVVRRPKPSVLAVDAGHGFAFPAFDRVVAELPAMANAAGIAAALVSHSHHAGALGGLVERLADAGLIALMYASTPAAMAPWGGKRAVYGTNPLAFAAPRRDKPALLIDLALTEVARSKLVAAAQKGEAIPLGWAVDEHGNPTTDAKAALKGNLLPAGGAKGAALALMVEVLASTLTGSRFGFEASSFLDDKDGPPDVGQMVIGIDAIGLTGGLTGGLTSDLAGGNDYFGRLEVLAGIIEADGARLPGSRRLALRETARRDGVTVDTRLLAEVRALGQG